MIGFLRFIGILNVSIWVGSSIFMTFGVTHAIFSGEMEVLLGKSYPPYSGYIAQLVFKKFFVLQTLCSIMALLHVLATWLYSGRPLQRLNFTLVISLLVLSLMGAFVVQPKLKLLHVTKYGKGVPIEQRDAAHRSMKVWHATSSIANMILLGSLFFYLWRLNNPTDFPRFISSSKFRS